MEHEIEVFLENIQAFQAECQSLLDTEHFASDAIKERQVILHIYSVIVAVHMCSDCCSAYVQ